MAFLAKCTCLQALAQCIAKTVPGQSISKLFGVINTQEQDIAMIYKQAKHTSQVPNLPFAVADIIALRSLKMEGIEPLLLSNICPHGFSEGRSLQSELVILK